MRCLVHRKTLRALPRAAFTAAFGILVLVFPTVTLAAPQTGSVAATASAALTQVVATTSDRSSATAITGTTTESSSDTASTAESVSKSSTQATTQGDASSAAQTTAEKTQSATAGAASTTPAATTSAMKLTAQSETLDLPAASAISGGIFTVSSSLDPNMDFDVPGGSSAAGAQMQLWTSNGTPAQRLRISSVDSDGYCTLVDVVSGLALDVRYAQAASGAAVQQYPSNGTDAQKWTIVTHRSESTGETDGYVIVSKLVAANGSRLVLDVPSGLATAGTALHIWEYNGTPAQVWRFDKVSRTVSDGIHVLASQLDESLVLDAAGAGRNLGTNVQLWSSNGTTAQWYDFSYDTSSGYYAITNANSQLALDVSNASGADGANVWLWQSNGTWAQRWAVTANADGSYSLRCAASGKMLDVSNGLAANGAIVWQWQGNGSKAQRWNISNTYKTAATIESGTYRLSSGLSSSVCLDDSGASTAQGANIQIWEANGTAAQQYEITSGTESGTYVIRCKASGKLLSDVDGNVVLTASAGPASYQTWRAWALGGEVELENVASGRVVDVAGGGIANGTNVQTWPENGTPAQRLSLVRIGALSLGITDVHIAVGNQELSSTTVSGNPTVFLPSGVSRTSVAISYDSTDGGTALVSSILDGPFTNLPSGTSVDLTSYGLPATAAGETKLFLRDSVSGSLTELDVMASSSVASLYLTSDDPSAAGRLAVDGSANHTFSATGSYSLLDASGAVTSSGRLTQIKGRGNTTWVESSKKPYQIKLAAKTDLLSTGDQANKAKTWVLLANSCDATLLHNSVAFDLARQLGLAETPQYEPIDLYYDGEYRGSYLLCEKVEINSGRVDIDNVSKANDEVNDENTVEAGGIAQGTNAYGYTFTYAASMNTPTSVSNAETVPEGYLLELDVSHYADELCWFKTSVGPFTSKGADYLSKDEMLKLSNFFQEALDCIAAGGRNPTTGKHTSDYFDLDSLAKTYLVEELSGNVDFVRWSSTYFYTKADASGTVRIYSGPVWDFDASFGTNASDGSLGTQKTGYVAAVHAFFSNDPSFQAAVKGIYTKGLLSTVTSDDASAQSGSLRSIVGAAAQLAGSEAMNERLWGLTSFYFQTAPAATYGENVDQLRDYLRTRDAWLYSTVQSWNGSKIV